MQTSSFPGPSLAGPSVRPTRFADKPFSRYSVNSMIFSLGNGGARRGRERRATGGKNNFLLLERASERRCRRQKRVHELSPLTCGSMPNLVLIIEGRVPFCCTPESTAFVFIPFTAFSSQIWPFCPKVTAGPCRPSCPKVRI